MSFGKTLKDFLKPSSLVGVLKSITPKVQSGSMESILPMVETQQWDVTFDVNKVGSIGRTPAVADGAESPILDRMIGGSRVTYEAIEWREKFSIQGTMLAEVDRKLGTDAETVDIVQTLMKEMNVMRSRLDNRLEFMRVQALTENKVDVELANGTVSKSIPYGHPSYLRPALVTASDKWSDHTASTPVEDIRGWYDDLYVDLPIEGLDLFLSRKVEGHLRANDKVEEYLRDVHVNIDQSARQAPLENKRGHSSHVARAFNFFLGDVLDFNVYDRGETLVGVVTTAANAGQADIEVEVGRTGLSVDDFAPGMRIKIQNRARQLHEVAEIASISGNTITLTGNLSTTFPRGSDVSTQLKYMDENKVLMVGKFYAPDYDTSYMDTSLNADDGNMTSPSRIGSVLSVKTQYFINDGQPGYFMKNIDKTNNDPPAMQVVGGIKALPRIDYPEYYLVATVT